MPAIKQVVEDKTANERPTATPPDHLIRSAGSAARPHRTAGPPAFGSRASAIAGPLLVCGASVDRCSTSRGGRCRSARLPAGVAAAPQGSGSWGEVAGRELAVPFSRGQDADRPACRSTAGRAVDNGLRRAGTVEHGGAQAWPRLPGCSACLCSVPPTLTALSPGACGPRDAIEGCAHCRRQG